MCIAEFCSSLNNMTIPSSVKEMWYAIFTCCDELETVIFKEGVNNAGSHSFKSCPSLKSITIPGTVTEICAFAFEPLKKIGIPNAVFLITSLIAGIIILTRRKNQNNNLLCMCLMED